MTEHERKIMRRVATAIDKLEKLDTLRGQLCLHDFPNVSNTKQALEIWYMLKTAPSK